MRPRSLLPVLVPVLATSLALGAPPSFAAQQLGGPTLTVVGFGLRNLTPSKTVIPPALELNLETSAATATLALKDLERDVTAVEQALAAISVAKTAITTQGPPSLHFVSPVSEANCENIDKLKGVPASCPGPGFQAYEQLQVTFPNLAALAAALTKSGVAKAAGVQNFWVNQGGAAPPTAGAAALGLAYRQAFQDALHSARRIAGADHLVLGSVVSLTEGSILSTPCGGLGCGPTPLEGLVAVTVRYRTVPMQPYRGLTRSAILRLLATAREVGTLGEHLALMGPIVTVSDGLGGTLTAVPALRFPTADGYGQLVLFWHDTTFIGSDNQTRLPDLGPEAISLGIVSKGRDYRPSDPMVAPSLPPGFVRYARRDGRLAASAAVPRGATNDLRMVLP